MIAEDFGAKGPIAPGLPVTEGCDPNGPTLFKFMTADCIASASLGQVPLGACRMVGGRVRCLAVARPRLTGPSVACGRRYTAVRRTTARRSRSRCSGQVRCGSACSTAPC